MAVGGGREATGKGGREGRREGGHTPPIHYNMQIREEAGGEGRAGEPVEAGKRSLTFLETQQSDVK